MNNNTKGQTGQPESDAPADDARLIDLRAADIRALLAAKALAPTYIVGLDKWREYGFTSYESIKSAAAHGLKVCKGPRGRLMATVEDVHAWIQSRPLKPKAPKKPASDLADWEAQADAELEAMTKGGAA